jgi:hypothetical protein
MGQEGSAVRRFRYRTAVLTGPWRDSEEEAVLDAVKARQAELDGASPSEVRWIVPGRIEEMAADEKASKQKS